MVPVDRLPAAHHDMIMGVSDDMRPCNPSDGPNAPERTRHVQGRSLLQAKSEIPMHL